MHTVASAIEYDDSTPESNAIRCRTDHISRHWHIRLSIIFTHRQLSVVGARCSVHNAQRTAHTRTFTCSLATMPCLSHTRYNKPRYVMFESMWLPSVSNKNYHISSQPAVCLNIQIKLKTSFCFCVFSVCFAGLVVRVAGRLRRI